MAAPGEGRIEVSALTGDAADAWQQVVTGAPTLVEDAGRQEPEAHNIDPPLLAVTEEWLDQRLTGGLRMHHTGYDNAGNPTGVDASDGRKAGSDARIATLATRNQAVNDTRAMPCASQPAAICPTGVIKTTSTPPFVTFIPTDCCVGQPTGLRRPTHWGTCKAWYSLVGPGTTAAATATSRQTRLQVSESNVRDTVGPDRGHG